MPGTVQKSFEPTSIVNNAQTKAAVAPPLSTASPSAAFAAHPIAGVASTGPAQLVAVSATTSAQAAAQEDSMANKTSTKDVKQKGKAVAEAAAEKASDLKQFVERPGHFSLVRNFHLADAFTLMNGFCGAQSLFASARYLITSDPIHAWHALWFPVAGAIFDLLDGKVARWRKSSSMLGQELDSLADSVSFGVAPAFAAFALGLRLPVDTLFLTCFVCAGIARLARFNVTTASVPHDASGKARYFEGLPIPSSLILVGCMAVCMLAGRVAPGGLPLVLAREKGVGAAGFTFFGALRDHIPGATSGIGVPLGTWALDATHFFSSNLVKAGLSSATARDIASYAKVEVHKISFLWLFWSALFISKTIRIPKP